MDDWRMKMGKIAPSVYIHADQYQKMLPEGAEIVVVTTGEEEYSEENLSNAGDEVYEAVRRLDARDVDCIIAGGTPIYALMGADEESALLKELREELNAPISSSLTAQVDALNALNVESLAVVTPYPPERDQERKEYFESHGFEVVKIGGRETQYVTEAVGISPAEYYKAARELNEEIEEDFDAINIPGAALRVVDFIEALEQDTGKLVVTSAQAQVWKACQLTGINPNIEGYGELFETLHK